MNQINRAKYVLILFCLALSSAVIGQEKALSLYKNQGSYISGPRGFEAKDCVLMGVFDTENFGMLYYGYFVNEDSQFRAGFKAHNMKSLVIKNEHKVFTAGCALPNDEIVLAAEGYLIREKLSITGSVTLKTKELLAGVVPLAMANIGNNRVMSIWRNSETNQLYLQVWDYQLNEMKSILLQDTKEEFTACIDVSTDMTKAAVLYKRVEGGGLASQTIVLQMSIGNELMADDLKADWEYEIGPEYLPYGCRFTAENELVVLTLTEDSPNQYRSIGIVKISKEGKYVVSNAFNTINPTLWSRDEGSSISLYKEDELYLDDEASYFLVENELEGELYIVGRMESEKINYKFAGKSDYTYGDSPFMIGINETSLEVENFDFIDFVDEEGQRDKGLYKEMHSYNYSKLDYHFAYMTPYEYLIIELPHKWSYGVTYLWKGHLSEDAKKGDVTQGASSSTSNSSANNSNSSKTQTKYYVKNTTGKSVKIGNGSGWTYDLSNGSTREIDCDRPTYIMVLNGSSCETGSQISNGKGVCGKTIDF